MELLLLGRVDAGPAVVVFFSLCAPSTRCRHSEDFNLVTVEIPVARGENLVNTVDCCVHRNRPFPIVAAYTVSNRIPLNTLHLGPDQQTPTRKVPPY